MNWNSANDSCDRAREAIADRILDRGVPHDDTPLDAHLSGCAACRAYLAECEAIWSALDHLAVPAPRKNARALFDEALQRAEHPPAAPNMPPTARRNGTRRTWIAAGMAAAALLGFGAAQVVRPSVSSAPAIPTAALDSLPKYLLLLYDTKASDPEGQTPADIAKLVAEYSAWGRTLRDSGLLLNAEKLTDDPSHWFGGTTLTSNGERLGGFFLIRARDLADALRIAGGCPHLKHGGRVELRAIYPT